MGVADLWLKVINARFLDRGGEAEGRLPALHKQPAFEWRVVMRFSAVTVTQPHAWGFQYRAVYSWASTLKEPVDKEEKEPSSLHSQHSVILYLWWTDIIAAEYLHALAMSHDCPTFSENAISNVAA